jgi:hypothetical protein
MMAEREVTAKSLNIETQPLIDASKFYEAARNCMKTLRFIKEQMTGEEQIAKELQIENEICLEMLGSYLIG